MQELSNEKLNSENIKQQKLQDEKTIHELKSEVDKLYTENSTLRKKESEITTRFEDEITKLKEKNRNLLKKLENKQQRIFDIRCEIVHFFIFFIVEQLILI